MVSLLSHKWDYYNDIDPFVCEWVRELIKAGEIPPGEVDSRSIEDIEPADLVRFRHVHMFCGIAGWAYAMRLAEWPDDVPLWTGSCPCQPFSSAARGQNRGTSDQRHLWPIWRNLIAARRPRLVCGEQVASAYDWLDQVWYDMEALSYTFRPVVLPACAIGADHIRERVWFCGDTYRDGKPRCSVDAKAFRLPWRDCQPDRVAAPNGISRDVVALSGFGNAIVPQVAAEVLRAWREVMR